MRYRKFGKANIEVSEIGYGAWGIGGHLWLGGNDEESLAALRRAFELGLNFVDTALAYGNGHSEKLVGQVSRETSSKVYIATKVPPKNFIWPAQPGSKISDVFPYDYIVKSTEQSLRNLGVDCIDVQQLHVWNPEWIDRDDWRRAFEDLKKSGKARAVGVSINDHQPDSAIDLVNTGLIDTVQVIYNIFDQTPEKNLFSVVQKMNVGVMVRVPFDEGSLTGTITQSSEFEKDDFRARYFRGDRKKQVEDRVSALKNALGQSGGDDRSLSSSSPSSEASLPETALRFCLSHPAVSTVIPGMRKVKNVEQNCRVSDQGPLPAPVLQMLKKHAWDRNFYL